MWKRGQVDFVINKCNKAIQICIYILIDGDWQQFVLTAESLKSLLFEFQGNFFNVKKIKESRLVAMIKMLCKAYNYTKDRPINSRYLPTIQF